MVRTYIRLAIRSLLKNKVFSFINIIGLAIGLTSCLLIGIYIVEELSYDKHQQLGDRLYHLGTINTSEGTDTRSASAPSAMGPAMQREFPEIEATTRLMKAFEDDKTLLQNLEGNDVRSFYETQGYLADSNFFQLFTYNFKEGNARTALANPTNVVLSEEIAKKLFGATSALGKTVHIKSATNGEGDFQVAGVFIPSKNPSHIDARFFLSMQGGEVGPWVRGSTTLMNNNLFYNYFLLKPGTDPKKLEEKFVGFIERHAGNDLRASGRWRKQFLTPVKDIHLYSDSENSVTPGGSLRYLYILFSIALVTILIACVNFMNLSTARSSKRAVEIGVRKVLGAEKSSLVRQFLWEAIILSIISFLLSIGFTFLLLPTFEKIAGVNFSFSGQQYLYLAAGFLIITLIAGLVAGLYPAFYLSAFKPVKVLKGKFSNSLAAISFRKVLVVFQFVIAIGLIVASITISNQMSFLRKKDLGFEKDQQIVIPMRTATAKQNYPRLKDELSKNTAITSTGASYYYPGVANVTDWLMYKQGNTPDQTKTVYINRVDYSYLQTLGIKAVAGRLFSREFMADTNNAMIINEEAVRQFGYKTSAEAIGKNIVMRPGNEEYLFNIVGVVNDFHFKDLHASIEGYGFLLHRNNSYNYAVAHSKGGDMKAALNVVTAAWRKVNPDEPFEYSFVDEDFQKNYFAEERLATIIRSFTIVAIFISCLGLFGLTTFSVEQRTKEIGIRKVLGASTVGIISLLSKDFLKLVLISFLLASPLAWFFVNRWLEGFAYRAPFTVWILIGACVLALLIAFMTISIQAAKVAFANPVKSLRSE